MTVLAQQTLTELVDRAAAGDEGAFMDFYDLTGHRVYALALARTRDPARAETITGRHFVEAWRRVREQQASGLSPLAWLFSLDTELQRAVPPGTGTVEVAACA